jgi:hypothetical protein
MNAHRRRDERGASLVLAIVFLVVVGALTTATLAHITSGLNQRRTLDSVRDREYAADAAIEYAIADVRVAPGPGPALSSCPPPSPPTTDHTHFGYHYQVAGKAMRVDCINAPTLTFGGFTQRNVIFVACEDSGSDCGSPSGNKTIIRAQVNYQALGQLNAPVITGTQIQSWSVNS